MIFVVLHCIVNLSECSRLVTHKELWKKDQEHKNVFWHNQYILCSTKSAASCFIYIRTSLQDFPSSFPRIYYCFKVWMLKCSLNHIFFYKLSSPELQWFFSIGLRKWLHFFLFWRWRWFWSCQWWQYGWSNILIVVSTCYTAQTLHYYYRSRILEVDWVSIHLML